jgi:hypothetical protein
MNALAIGTPTAGLTVTALGNGALYFTQYQIQVTGLTGGHLAILDAYVSTTFTHPSAFIMENCPSSAACGVAGSYSAMSTNAGARSVVIASPGIGNTTVTAGFGMFLPDNNGATAFTGNDSGSITLRLTDTTSHATATAVINLTPQTLQRAVQLTLGSAPGGVTITPASDFSMSFGNVNGIGIGPGAGLTTVPKAGGIIYSTPYLLNPVFSAFASTTGTLSVYVSTNFVHPAILILNDSGVAGGPYNAISTTPATPTQLTTTAANRSSITRYLGLFVANTNGGGAFTGADNARLTFTLTVP